MTPQINDIWGYLSASPLLGLAVTLLAYQAAFWLYRRSGINPVPQPLVVAKQGDASSRRRPGSASYALSGHRPPPVRRTPDVHLPGLLGCAPAAHDGQ